MRYFFNSLIACVIVLFLGCQQLNITPDSSISNNSFWRTEADAEAALNGLYNRYRNQFATQAQLYWYECRTGLIAPGLQPGGIASFINNTITPNLNPTNWQPFYSVISMANAIIDNVDKVNFSNQQSKDEIKAQAYFLRALCYFDLARIWGEVPLVTAFIDSDSHEQLYPNRSPIEQVFELIKADINFADQLCPNNNAQNRTRASRAAILMLKTDIYLWLARVLEEGNSALDVANLAVDEVLSYAAYHLENDYETVFLNDNSGEIIFSIYFDLLENSSQYGHVFGQSRSLVPQMYRNNPIPVGTTHIMQFSDLFYARYRNRTEGDRRGEVISQDMEISGTNFRWTNKFMGEMNGNVREFTSDTRVYRLSEAYLFKAEILAEQGNIDEAIELLNVVVSRAYGVDDFYKPGIDPNDFNNILLDERIIEFAGERKSWFDYIRFDQVFQRVPSLVGREDDNQGNILYFPVNPITISRNPNIKQTPGFE